MLLDGRVLLSGQERARRLGLVLLLARMMLPDRRGGRTPVHSTRTRASGQSRLAASQHLHALGYAHRLEGTLDEHLALVLAARALVYLEPNLALVRPVHVDLNARARKAHSLVGWGESEELCYG